MSHDTPMKQPCSNCYSLRMCISGLMAFLTASSLCHAQTLASACQASKCICIPAEKNTSAAPKWWDNRPLPAFFDSNGAMTDCKSTKDDPGNRSVQWRGSAKMTFNDSTRDTNHLRDVSATLIDADTCNPGSGDVPKRPSLLLSFTAELPKTAFDSNGNVTPAAMNNNFLRLAFRGKPVPQGEPPDAHPYFAVSLPIVSTSIGIGDGWPVPVTYLLTDGRSLCDQFSSNCTANTDYRGDSDLGRINVLTSANNVSNSIQPTAISWFNAPSGSAPGFMVIQVVLPFDLMDVDGDPGAFPFWYGIDLASPATNQTGTGYSNVIYDSNSYSMGFAWPGALSVPANGGEPDLGRVYPGIAQWGFLVDNNRNPLQCKAISLEAISITAVGPQVPPIVPGQISLSASPIFTGMGDAINGKTLSAGVLTSDLYVAAWGSQPFQLSQSPVDASVWKEAVFKGYGSLTKLDISDGNGGLVPDVQTAVANWTFDLQAPATAPVLPGVLVRMSDKSGFFYTNNDVLNNAVSLTASKIDVPATVTIKGLAPLKTKATRNVYVQVVPTNMPKYQDSNPGGGASGGDGAGKDLAGAIGRALEWLSNARLSRTNQRSGAVKAGASTQQPQAPAPASPAPLDVESIRYGVASGALSANHVHELLAARLIQPEALEAALPTFRVRVFHDTDAKVKWVDQDKRDLGLHDVVEAQAAFGFVAVHQGPTTGWRYSLTLDDKVAPLPGGAKIVAVPGDPNRFVIQDLPADSTFQLSAHVEAVEPRPWSIELVLGVAVPNGSFSSSNQSGPAATIAIEREVVGHMVSAFGHIGVASLPGNSPWPSASVRDFGAGAKIYLLRPADWRPYVLSTLDQYHFVSGSTKAGYSLGLGLQRELTPDWSLDFRYGTHWISSNSPQSRFSSFLAGVRYSF